MSTFGRGTFNNMVSLFCALNPKAEGRNPKENRNPKAEKKVSRLIRSSAFGFRVSDLKRVEAIIARALSPRLSRVSILAGATVVCLAASTPQLAYGDGGSIQLREAKGPFSITVFATPQATAKGRTDVSVLVQSRTNGAVVLDADVELAIDPPTSPGTSAGTDAVCGAAPAAALFPSLDMGRPRPTIRTTRGQASNKLLYAADLALHAPGSWRLHVYVSRGSSRTKFDCLIPVIKSSVGAQGLWPYLLIPPIAIAAFALNQKLRRGSLEGDPDSPTGVAVSRIP